MSLFETGHASGDVSVGAMLQGMPPRARDPGLTVTALAERASVGGWPGHVDRGVDESLEAVRSYLDEIRRVDVGRVDQTVRDPEKIGRLLASLGRLMIVENQPAWAPHLRSKSRLRKASKRHFLDPSLAVAAVGATPTKLLEDLSFFGFVFESMVIRDLRIYAQAADAEVLQYQDNTGLEVDAIVRARDGRWAAFEVKLGQRQVDDAARNLIKFRDERVDTASTGDPALLAVVTSGGLSYVREDGVAVISVGALGP